MRNAKVAGEDEMKEVLDGDVARYLYVYPRL